MHEFFCYIIEMNHQQIIYLNYKIFNLAVINLNMDSGQVPMEMRVISTKLCDEYVPFS